MVTLASKTFDYYMGERILDRAHWRGIDELSALCECATTYVYQLEWSCTPFYVGITCRPERRLSTHLSNVWHDRVAVREPGSDYPATFNDVIRAARAGLSPQMRLIDAYSHSHSPQRCEACWIAQRQAEGFYLVNDNGGTRVRTCACAGANRRVPLNMDVCQHARRYLWARYDALVEQRQEDKACVLFAFLEQGEEGALQMLEQRRAAQQDEGERVRQWVLAHLDDQGRWVVK